MFPKEPKCELCKEKVADAFVCLSFDGAAKWVFCNVDYLSDEKRQGYWHTRYVVTFDQFFKTPAATVDWLAHMNEKTWMNWKAFMEMMYRFRCATGSFDQ